MSVEDQRLKELLEGLNLGKYYAKFLEEETMYCDLQELSENELSEIISKRIHRKRLQKFLDSEKEGKSKGEDGVKIEKANSGTSVQLLVKFGNDVKTCFDVPLEVSNEELMGKLLQMFMECQLKLPDKTILTKDRQFTLKKWLESTDESPENEIRGVLSVMGSVLEGSKKTSEVVKELEEKLKLTEKEKERLVVSEKSLKVLVEKERKRAEGLVAQLNAEREKSRKLSNDLHLLKMKPVEEKVKDVPKMGEYRVIPKLDPQGQDVQQGQGRVPGNGFGVNQQGGAKPSPAPYRPNSMNTLPRPNVMPSSNPMSNGMPRPTNSMNSSAYNRQPPPSWSTQNFNQGGNLNLNLNENQQPISTERAMEILQKPLDDSIRELTKEDRAKCSQIAAMTGLSSAMDVVYTYYVLCDKREGLTSKELLKDMNAGGLNPIGHLRKKCQQSKMVSQQFGALKNVMSQQTQREMEEQRQRTQQQAAMQMLTRSLGNPNSGAGSYGRGNKTDGCAVM